MSDSSNTDAELLHKPISTLMTEDNTCQLYTRKHLPIAICGYGFRLPGGLETDEDFWELLARRGYVQENIADRYGEGAASHDGFTTNPTYAASQWEGLIREGKELEFDCALFGVSVHDAKRMDPQIKMMLIVTWEALQCAGMDQQALHNSNTGVFTGIQTSAISGWRPSYGSLPGDVPGRSGSMIANRISFHFNWMGPSYSVATACSSGVTALDAAVKSLELGECDVAAFGAVQYLGYYSSSVGFNALGIISKTGTSRSFDKDANGYMRSEGAFMYILKRLEDAERDGDRIFGVIRGCALNTAGAEKDAEILTQGRMIVAPVMHAQQSLMHQVISHVGFDPKTIDYVEAHATGTVLGDATEGNAIANVYGSVHRETPLRLSSVRSNIGHMEAASFTCSFLKILIMLQKRQFAPISSHYKSPTDKIPFYAKKMKVLTEVEPFPEDRLVRIGINSFGFGGANGHCVIEEYRMPDRNAWSSLPGKLENKVYTVPFSAKDEEALAENARRLAHKLDDIEKQVDMYTLVGNLSVRMTHNRVRTALTASTIPELKTKLNAFAEKSELKLLKEEEISRIQLPSLSGGESQSNNILFVFPGQGSQWAGCGRDLYETEVVFRRVVDSIDREWIKLAGCKLSDIAFDENIDDRLNECCWAQPVTFLLQVAMYEVFIAHGIHPKAVLGHSAGEASAAYASGAYTLEEACFLVYHRSRLQSKLAGCGRMLVLMLDSQTTEEMLTRLGFVDSVEIACFNSQSNTVVCGTEDVIMDLREKLKADGQLTGTLIPGNIAFHSKHMLPIRDELLEALRPLDGSQPRCSSIPMISTVTGSHIKNFNAEYWYSNVREAVDLISAVATADKYVLPDVIIELSPHITLRSPIREFYTVSEKTMPKYIYTLVRKANTADMLAKSIGNCFMTGLPINFRMLFPRPYPITNLFPHYYMKRERVLDTALDEKVLTKKGFHSYGPMLGNYNSSDHLVYECPFSKKHFSWMADHNVQGQPIVPAAGYLEIILEAFKGRTVHVETARFVAPFVLTDIPKMMYAEFVPCHYAPHRYDYKIYSRDLVEDEALQSTFHCLGTVEVIPEKTIDAIIPPTVPRNLADDEHEYSHVLYKDQQDFYSTMSARIGHSFEYGPIFQGICRVSSCQKTRTTRLDVKIDQDLWEKWDMMGFQFHPTMLDAALQSFLVYVMDACDFNGVPQTVKNMVFLSKPTSGTMTIIYEPPEYLKGFHQKGQLAFGLGERSAGHIAIYDGVTGDLITTIGDYASFTANTKMSDLKQVKHYLSWQPKDDVQAENYVASFSSLTNGSELGSTTCQVIKDIISRAHPEASTPFFLNAAECIIGSIPQRLALEGCLSSITNAPVQYTVISGNKQFLTDSYQRWGTSNADANLRFATIEEEFSKGFLRPAMFEFLLIRINIELDVDGEPQNNDEKELEEYRLLSSLAAPGSMVLVESNRKEIIPPASGWTCLWQSPITDTASTFTLFKAPPLMAAKVTNVSATTIVVDDKLGFSDYWKCECVETSSIVDVDFEQSRSWQRVDYFAMHDDSEELFDGPAKLAEFVKQMSLRRTGSKDVTPCIFTIFTSGAMHCVTSPSQCGVWGATRSMLLEVGEACSLDFRLVDVATKEDLCFASPCEIMRERELCVHNGRLWTCRLVNIREAMPTADVGADTKDSFRLFTNNSGLIADLEYRLEELPPLKPNDIEISVKAAALNFRDIMIGLGKLPLLSFEASMLGRTVGMECSGVVERCGSDVRNFKVGDKVLAMQGGCIANRLACSERAAYKLPSNITFEEGSATASVYVTAYYALVYLARMREGQSVLVHSALGGVGQAAIALCKLYGAKVYGTAGSEEKRRVLCEMGCVDAFDSHSTQWFPDLMASTNGRGVDIVLNSLAGEHLDLCLEALAPGGMHCEIGKVDIFANRPVKMSVFRKNIAFRAVDVDRLMTDDPDLTRELCGACLELIEEGKVPALPCTVFSYKDYHDALRYMMNGQHRGKLVLVPPGPGETVRAVDHRSLYGSGKDGNPRTILMSGCLGGFGLRVLAYVIALGARNIVLLDRDPERKRTVEWVIDATNINLLIGKIEGLRIEIVYGDVGVYQHVVDAVASVDRLGMPPIGSVFHLAGILDDKKLENMDRESFSKVFQPKADGAWNLHRATQHCTTIDHFVMFSSTSSAFGNMGQTNYSAANAFQDGLAAMRIQSGKPALSFCMGAVVEAGMAARSTQLLQMMKAGGMPAISCILAIEALDAAVRRQSHWNLVAALAKDLPANFESTDYLRTFAQLIKNNAAFKMGGSANLSREALIELLSERVGKLCGVEKIAPAEPFSSYGLNSISVAELATYLKNEMSYNVSAMQLMTSATCESIADGIIHKTQGTPADSDGSDLEEAELESEVDDSSEVSNPDSHQEDELVWTLPVVQQKSLFLPKIQEYFTHPPPMAVTPNFATSLSKSHTLTMEEEKLEKEFESDGEKWGNLAEVYENLPKLCRDAVDELSVYIDSIDTSNVAAPVPVANIKRVLLTGATGFVGRHFIADLLNHTSNIEMIYCPVRADTDALAMERVIAAMEEAGTWKEAFGSRLRVFNSDLTDEFLGVSKDFFEELVNNVDAVYHFASNLKLAGSFQELRKNNCDSMRAVFRLCLSTRQKHLFLASTLGLFPQYFCLFANEMTNKPISRDAMPDMTQMKRIFPLSLSGYAWSKFVIELAALNAQKYKGLNLAVFRLPLMATNSKTGFTSEQDPWIQFAFATFQLRLVPGKTRPIAMEDSAMSNEMMLRISLNPDRKNTIYHCSYMSQSLQDRSMIGFPCQNTTYENFKAQCLKLGQSMPLNTYWPLLDQFAPYWFNFKCYAEESPIDISTVVEDCYPLPRKVSTLEVMYKSMEWATLFQDRTPIARTIALSKASTDIESILTPARKFCQRYELDFNEAIKPHVIEGLHRVCEELHTRNSILPSVVLDLTTRIQGRVQLYRLLQLHPEIHEECIEAPLFIVGLDQIGNTFLQRMLEATGSFEAPHIEDQFYLPKAEAFTHPDDKSAKKRLEAIASYLDFPKGAGSLEIELGVAAEDMVAHACSFMSLEFDVTYDLPKYRTWLENQSFDPVYEEHRTWMQFISWWRRRQNPDCASRWCFNYPWHLRSLESLLKVYPDARLVHTHRDVKDVAGLWCAFVKNQRKLFVEEIDDHQLGQDQLTSLATTLAAGIEFRKANPELEEKWIDIHFNQIVSSPIDTAKKVCAHVGAELDDDAEANLTSLVKQVILKRDALFKNQPKAEDYGISSQDLHERNFEYREKSYMDSLSESLFKLKMSFQPKDE